MFMKDNPYIKSSQKGLNADEIASNIHHHLNNCIINGECCNVDNGKVTSCRCIAYVDNNMEVRHKLLEAMIEFNNYNTTNMKLYLQGIVLQGYLIKQRKPLVVTSGNQSSTSKVFLTKIMNHTFSDKIDYVSCSV